MKRLILLPFFAVMLGCPSDKNEVTDSLPVDTTRLDTTVVDTADLSAVTSQMPAASPDTFTQRDLARTSGATGRRAASGGEVGARVPEAPPALVTAVEREASFSRFCYTEFGQKADPSLQGNVVMVVTVGVGGITGAKVGDSKWTGNAGAAVDRCLNERAERAWKLAPGAVQPGKYAVRLSFAGS